MSTTQQPTEQAYRIAAVDKKRCVGRILTEGAKDTRWTKHIYYEGQCIRLPQAGSDICGVCAGRAERMRITGKHGPWNGRVTEDPPAWCHMLGTAWAVGVRWLFGGAAEGESNAAGGGPKPKAVKAKAVAKPVTVAAAEEDEDGYTAEDRAWFTAWHALARERYHAARAAGQSHVEAYDAAFGVKRRADLPPETEEQSARRIRPVATWMVAPA